jgi:FMN phosphatase YigB (HAD superfamily)
VDVAASRGPGAPRAVLFDLDDVLVPFHTPKLWQWAWRPQGPVVNERRLTSALRRSLRAWDQRRWHGVTGGEPPADLAALEQHLAATLVAIAGHPLPPEESAAVVRRLLHPTGEVERYADASRALARLRSAGTSLGVLTPFPRESAEWLLKRAGLSEVPVVGAGDPPGPPPPHRDAFRAGAAKLGAGFEETAFVGDLLWSDVRAARRAGLSPVLLDRLDAWPPARAGRITSLDGLEAALLSPPPSSEGDPASAGAEPGSSVEPPKGNIYTASPGPRAGDADPQRQD